MQMLKMTVIVGLLAGLSSGCKDEPAKKKDSPPPVKVHNPTPAPQKAPAPAPPKTGGTVVAQPPVDLETHQLGPVMGGGPLAVLTKAHLAAYTAGLKGDGKLTAIIETDYGAFDCELFEEKAPLTVANFVGLARGLRKFTDSKTNKPGKRPFFDGTQCHRVIPNFMIQCGDPTATGGGGPGYRFADEFHPELRHDRPALLSMANAGVSTNGSQFFITERPTPHLNDKHSVFGACTPADLVKTITRVPKDPKDPMRSRPATPVVIKTLSIVRK